MSRFRRQNPGGRNIGGKQWVPWCGLRDKPNVALRAIERRRSDDRCEHASRSEHVTMEIYGDGNDNMAMRGDV